MPKKAAATEMAEPGEGSKSGGVSKGSMVATALVVVTAASFYQVKFLSGPGGSKGVERDGNYLKGLAVACLALVGNAMVGAFRKILSQHNIGSAQQVGLAALIQGVCAVLHCLYSGDLKLGSAQEMKDALPPAVFWCVCVCVLRVCVVCLSVCLSMCVCLCVQEMVAALPPAAFWRMFGAGGRGSGSFVCMRACMQHARMHACKHACACVCMHAYMRACMYGCMHACVCVCVCVCVRALRLTLARIHTLFTSTTLCY